jgi:hypothetical protein
MSTTEEHDYVSAVFIHLLQRLPIFAIACFSWAAANQTKSKHRPWKMDMPFRSLLWLRFFWKAPAVELALSLVQTRNDVPQLLRSVISAGMIWPTKSRKYS